MNQELHVVLGAHGSMGQTVLSELSSRHLPIRAVVRRQNITGFDTAKADLLDLKQAVDAIKGASHVYLCVGMAYNTKTWQKEWPKMMENVIKACQSAGARLIFLDNIYMYGPSPLLAPFDESHPQNPPSKKGLVRKLVSDMMLEAHHSKRIKAVIGRSADFYGPKVINSCLYTGCLQNMLKGKAPQSLGRVDIKHTYAYTADNARALVSLALDESTYGQVWHLPVSEPVTMEDVIAIFNSIMGTQYQITMMPRILLGLLGVFVPILREVKEMLYQMDGLYIMNDSKFRAHFPDFKSTPLEEGLKVMVQSYQ